MKFKKFLPIVLSAALMLNFSACNKKGQISGDEDAGKIVATVGDENISAAEFKFYLNMYKQEVEREAGLTDKSDEEKKEYWNNGEGASKKQEIIDETFKNVKQLKVLLANAKKDNISIGKTDLDLINQSIEQFIEYEGNGDKQEANKVMLREYGVTIDQYLSFYSDFVLAYITYAEEKAASIEISDSEIQKEFENRKEEFEKVTVQHILLATKDFDTGEALPEDEVTKKKTLAEELLKRAQAGEDFGEMAKQYTEDDGSKDNGGEYTFPRGQMVAEFEDWSFNAKEGDMGIVETTYGYHVMKFIKHIPAALGDEERETISSALREEKLTQMVENMVAEVQLVKNQDVIDSLELF